jgi:putative SOS response-associated peptidase YedK
MCGRFSLVKSDREIKEELEVESWEQQQEYFPNFNVAPTQQSPVLIQSQSRTIEMMRWGLIPRWEKEKKIGSRMINARSETITEKPAFRNLVSHNRCVVVADGYYEWKRIGKEKSPYFIHPSSGDLLLMAGLWDSWHSPGEDRSITTFTIMTTTPAINIAHIHDRMPVILSLNQIETWLNTANGFSLEMVQPTNLSQVDLEAHRVSTRVNSVRNNSPDCIRPIAD